MPTGWPDTQGVLCDPGLWRGRLQRREDSGGCPRVAGHPGLVRDPGFVVRRLQRRKDSRGCPRVAGHPGGASRPWALVCDAFSVGRIPEDAHGSPDTQGRVASLGFGVRRLQRREDSGGCPRVAGHPGCALRPWALMCDAFSVGRIPEDAHGWPDTQGWSFATLGFVVRRLQRREDSGGCPRVATPRVRRDPGL